MTAKEAGDLLFPMGFCTATLNGSRCIIPATVVVDCKPLCVYHGAAEETYKKLWEAWEV